MECVNAKNNKVNNVVDFYNLSKTANICFNGFFRKYSTMGVRMSV